MKRELLRGFEGKKIIPQIQGFLSNFKSVHGRSWNGGAIVVACAPPAAKGMRYRLLPSKCFGMKRQELKGVLRVTPSRHFAC